ncbi:MAG: hypothetical protein Q4A93_05335 [Actinomycetota bacterium]|nr:hypothetical protein [Actinomycetota bacterium]
MPKAVRVSLPILLVAAVYCGGAPAELLGPGSEGIAGLIWTAAVLAAGTANVANAYTDRADGAPRRLAFWGMVLKLCFIPFYLLVLVGGFLLSIGLAVVPGLIFAVPVMLFMLFMIGYGLLLITSSYGFAAASRARSRGLLDRSTATVLTVAHAVPVVDVVAAIVLYAMARRTDSVSGSCFEGRTA